MKHTPGPWYCGHPEEPQPQIREEATGKTICLVYENGKANAALITAAPDLLKALKDLFEHCVMIHKHWGEGSNQREADLAIKHGEAAIAEAEGNS